MIDFREADPLREKVDDSTAAFSDILDAVVRASDDLGRYEDTDMSRWAGEAMRSLKKLSDVALLLRKRLSIHRRIENALEAEDRVRRGDEIAKRHPAFARKLGRLREDGLDGRDPGVGAGG